MYSRDAPDDRFFSARVHIVSPYRDLVGALGGSPIGYPLVFPRQRLSNWGSKSILSTHGCCCQRQAEDIPV
ncbi:hypothetical protein LSM04_005263 [Trypanosoma melophagium]|uniref:uncharacterized protein n=1 Tax=Trypanosoma melophagium TaxID=715481 RepID=UPI00351AAA23|nr:hypothetical protein LSM04_005263 [Trypanosoma melophagium]